MYTHVNSGERTESAGGSHASDTSGVKVILFDLWKTLTTSHCKEPIETLQRILGHEATDEIGRPLSGQLDDRFLRTCLTTDIRHPHHFVSQVGRQFGREVRPEHFAQFERVIQAESGCTALFMDVLETLEALKKAGYRLGVVSNLWAFPAQHIFDRMGLGQHFEHLIFSFEVGHRKPEPEIFEEAARRFGVLPSECLMIGDNLEADVKGALNVGMRAALIDRPGELLERLQDEAPTAIYLRSLLDLLHTLALNS